MSKPKSTEHPNHVKVNLPLARNSDKKDIGTLSLIRNNAWRLYDADGRRMVNPVLEDVITIVLTNPAGEQVTWLQMPSEKLFTELKE